MFVLKMNSPFFSSEFIIAIVLGFTLMILARLPFAGLFILMVDDFPSTSVHLNFEASQPLVRAQCAGNKSRGDVSG